jgi:hypothetical protein
MGLVVSSAQVLHCQVADDTVQKGNMVCRLGCAAGNKWWNEVRFKFITVSLANASQDGNEETHVPEYILFIRNTATAQGRRLDGGRLSG